MEKSPDFETGRTGALCKLRVRNAVPWWPFEVTIFLGALIVDNTLKLLYYDRSLPIQSEPICFLENPAALVAFLYCIQYCIQQLTFGRWGHVIAMGPYKYPLDMDIKSTRRGTSPSPSVLAAPNPSTKCSSSSTMVPYSSWLITPKVKASTVKNQSLLTRLTGDWRAIARRLDRGQVVGPGGTSLAWELCTIVEIYNIVITFFMVHVNVWLEQEKASCMPHGLHDQLAVQSSVNRQSIESTAIDF